MTLWDEIKILGNESNICKEFKLKWFNLRSVAQLWR